MSKIKIKLHPRKSFLFLGRIVLTYEMDSVELNTDELTDDEIRAIISSVIGNNIECDTSISDLLSFFKDEDRKTEFFLGLKAQRVDIDFINSRFKPVDVLVEAAPLTLEQIQEDYKAKYAHLVDLLDNNDEGTVIGYLREMQLNADSDYFAPVSDEVLEFLIAQEKSGQGRKMVVKSIFNLIGAGKPAAKAKAELKTELAQDEVSLVKEEKPARKAKQPAKE
jgi:hypothetical protein